MAQYTGDRAQGSTGELMGQIDKSAGGSARSRVGGRRRAQWPMEYN